MSPNQDILSVTAFFSALLHAAVILGVSFKLPEIANLKNKDNTLDVVLVSRSNNKEAENAEYISATDNEGGALDENDGSESQIYKPTAPSPIESIKLTAEQQPQTTLNPESLLTAQSAQVSVNKQAPKKTQLEIKPKTTGTDRVTTKSARQLQMQRLMRKIAKEREEYLKRPRKEYISPATRSDEAAGYLKDWQTKVEKLGNANYPAEARARNLAGSVSLSIEIKRDGTIALVHVDTPSKHKILTDSALRIVRRASPYEVFPDDLYPNKDIIVISRVFHFMPGNRLTTTDAAGPL